MPYKFLSETCFKTINFMKESVLHYVWQYRWFAAQQLTTTDGDTVEVIDVGKRNTDAGPDFFNAKIKIGGTLWAGNVEIHQFSSDWQRHGHNSDKSYDSVILHVVRKADMLVCRTDGSLIPQFELIFPQDIENEYFLLMNNRKWIPCADKISLIAPVYIRQWKTSLLLERLEYKIRNVRALLVQTGNHWEEAFYITLARNFGFGINGQPFELLAKSLSLTILAKHKNDLFQIEALLFGQAGLLSKEFKDDYPNLLRKEYLFLKQKYGLNQLESSGWKFMRIRPVNFPTVRMAQLASLIHGSSKLFSKIIENPDVSYVKNLISADTSEYWETHYTFDRESRLKDKKTGYNSVNEIIINTIIPVLFAYAEYSGNEKLKEKTLDMLEKLPPENNSIISGWRMLNMKVDSAFDSQALIQLKKNYCDEKKCLCCSIGHKVLTLNKK